MLCLFGVPKKITFSSIEIKNENVQKARLFGAQKIKRFSWKATKRSVRKWGREWKIESKNINA